MRRILPTILLLLLWNCSANAQPICAAKIPALAKRLNVAPISQPGLLVVDGCNGKSYDIIEIINKLLDKLDREAKR